MNLARLGVVLARMLVNSAQLPRCMRGGEHDLVLKTAGLVDGVVEPFSSPSDRIAGEPPGARRQANPELPGHRRAGSPLIQADPAGSG